MNIAAAMGRDGRQRAQGWTCCCIIAATTACQPARGKGTFLDDRQRGGNEVPYLHASIDLSKGDNLVNASRLDRTIGQQSFFRARIKSLDTYCM